MTGTARPAVGRKTVAVRRVLKAAAILAAALISAHHAGARLHWYLFSDKTYLKALLFVAIWVLSLSGPLSAAFCGARPWRVAYGILIPLLNAADDIHFRIMGESLNLTVLEKIINNPQLAGQVGTSYAHIALAPIACAGLMAFGILLPPRERRPRSSLALGLWPLAAGLLVAVPILRNPYFTSGWPAFYVTPTLLAKYAVDRPTLEKDDVTIPRTAEGRTVKHIALIIDESVRGDFIDSNGRRDTTPWLAGRGDVVNFGLSLSAYNCSAESNLILRNGANPLRMHERNRTILNNPGIWKYAKLAGYRTVYIDGQMPGGRLHSYMSTIERNLIDDFVYMTAKPVPAYERDVEAAKIIRDLFRSPDPCLVVFNKYGAHYHYEYSYPKEHAVFAPHLVFDEFPSDRTRMVNSYRNAVRWAVDHFFRVLLDGLDLSRSVIVYTSDHGQNLMDDGKPATHCRVRTSIPEEALVPLLAVTHDAEMRERLVSGARLNFDRASHFQIFPTLLVMMGYAEESVGAKYHRTLFRSNTAGVGYYSGAVFGANTQWNEVDIPRIRRALAGPP